ncbi:hypothetical protein AB0I60_01350 [Actinosynnema sp. NPDC050436]|uniref:hypothetical protein n=1 Tax=Actinosynnema sp. NPDC050436 TaxID=3155659 RepID=UPI0033C98BFA
MEGARMDLARLGELLRSVGGKMPDLVIDISEVTVLAESGGLKLIRWEERHRGAGDATARIATAALRDDKWLSVHETWAGSGTVAP